MTLERGTLLHKRYRIVEILGQGGMGSVYRAVDENLGVDVAVKENLFTTDEYARQFRLEAVILASLRHPNLPRVSNHFAVGDQGQYLIMDFIEGEDLRQRMERMGTITEEDAVMVGAAMCDALSYLHTRKPSILHRDIKPGNVKITPDGNIYLVDFGLAKLVQGTQATTTGARAMTPGYSPPEQYGTARTDPRTDIYSLGATLYAGLTGMIPEDGLARAMDNAQLTPLRKRNPKISRRLSVAIEKAMAVDPADRYQTAEDFKKALLGNGTRTERPTGEFTVVPPPPGSHARAESVAMDKADSDPRLANTPLPAFVPEEQKPFVPPSKRRRRNPIGLTLLFMLFIAGAGAFILYPNDIYPGVRDALPFTSLLPTVRAMLPLPALQSTATATSTTAPTATAIPATPTSQPTPTATQVPTRTPTSVVTSSLQHTPTVGGAPIGGGPGQIAFASNRSGIPQIYLSDLTGSVAVPITNMPDGACEPAWSPNGQQIAFVSPCKKVHDISEPPPQDTVIYIANADGSEPTALPTMPGGDSEPAWSPDGKRIAFTSLRDGRPLIYIITLADENVIRLTEPSADFDIARQPAWSPFGNQIVFAKKRAGAYQVWSMTDAGQGEQQIVRSGQTFWDYLPLFSPDGKDVLFSERNAAGPVYPQLFEMFIEYEKRGSSASIQVPLTNPVENVHFSPDGQWYVFEVRSANDIPDIYYSRVGAPSAERTRLTTDPGADFDPAWRP
jgi:eukaryotic-like serine/threonine-protein kinase